MRENWQRREEKRGGEGGEGGEDVKLDKGEKRDKPKTDATTIERVSCCPNPDFSEDICISRCCTSFFCSCVWKGALKSRSGRGQS